MRRRRYNVLSGSIFSIWPRIKAVIHKNNNNQIIKVIRLKTIDGQKILGVLLPNETVDDMIEDLITDSEEFTEREFLAN